jgi:hypothetical protein
MKLGEFYFLHVAGDFFDPSGGVTSDSCSEIGGASWVADEKQFQEGQIPILTQIQHFKP